MSLHQEVTLADEAQFAFLEEDDDLLEQEPDLLEPGQRALSVTTMDGDGVVIIGSLQELLEFVRLVKRGIELEMAKGTKT